MLYTILCILLQCYMQHTVTCEVYFLPLNLCYRYEFAPATQNATAVCTGERFLSQRDLELCELVFDLPQVDNGEAHCKYVNKTTAGHLQPRQSEKSFVDQQSYIKEF